MKDQFARDMIVREVRRLERPLFQKAAYPYIGWLRHNLNRDITVNEAIQAILDHLGLDLNVIDEETTPKEVVAKKRTKKTERGKGHP